MEHSPSLPVVLVHGTRVSGTMWRPVADLVGGAVALPDLPGHGRRRGEPFTMDGAVAAVAEAVDGLGGRALVAGLSLGGYVGIAAAARHPERVAGLVAVGCTTVAAGPTAAVYRTMAGLAARDPERANRLGARAFRRTLPAPAAAAMVAGGLSSEVFPGVVAEVATLDPPALLRAYPGPVWLVNGERDHLRRDERAFLAACRDGRLALVPRRGHISVLAEPTTLAQIIQDARTIAERNDPRPATPHP
ncbi:alpha/beta fold hydrolase [Actinomadura kijaniata]|uniref:alpha/beta fold hydrolase n=1 Tax=Actinomadura kijaniata TaxID=46161 RepID=UPI0008334A77|nr:alpha/beta hydrolase [Actinomadura kijaniata]